MFADLFGDLQKRTGRYLLQRYLGQFLDGKLSLEQLNINLLNGRGTVNDVSLSCKVRLFVFFFIILVGDLVRFQRRIQLKRKLISSL